MAEQTYLTQAELLERWRGAIKHVGTLANWRNAGRGPEYVKIERKVLYPLKSVEEYERANLHRPLSAI
jgi:hypothetical protein